MAKIDRSDAEVFRKTGGHEYFDDSDRQAELGLNVDPMKETGFTHGVDDSATFEQD